MPVEKMTFDELVQHATAQIHFGLLEGGSDEMRSRVRLWMGQAI